MADTKIKKITKSITIPANNFDQSAFINILDLGMPGGDFSSPSGIPGLIIGGTIKIFGVGGSASAPQSFAEREFILRWTAPNTSTAPSYTTQRNASPSAFSLTLEVLLDDSLGPNSGQLTFVITNGNGIFGPGVLFAEIYVMDA